MSTNYNPLAYTSIPQLPKDKVSVQGKNAGESGKAICFIPDYIDSYENLEQEKVWIPLSQVHEIHPDRLVMQRWIAEKKGLL